MNLPNGWGDVKVSFSSLTAWLKRATLLIGLGRKETNLKDKQKK